MPIYAYRCAACGHSKDVLRKLSDPPLSVCPACGADAFTKQLTAAGFQLKGSGWYVTDFRNGSKGGKADGGDAKPAGDKPAAEKPAEKPAADKPADVPAKSSDGGGDSGGGSQAASSATCGGSCACH